MKIKILSLRAVFLDDQASGSVVTVLTLFPELLDDMQAAIEAWHADATADLQTAHDTAVAQVAVLQAKLDPAPLPNYYFIAPLDPLPANGGTHAGVVGLPNIGGGAWIYDLLVEKAPGIYARLATDQQAPSDPKLTRVDDLSSATAAADISRALAPAEPIDPAPQPDVAEAPAPSLGMPTPVAG